MSATRLRVHQVARTAGVSVRTLHHYDQLGLLTPSARSQTGYRLYSREDLERLQQILLWRELGFPLEEIRRILDDPGFDRKEALRLQKDELERRARRVAAMIRSVEAALASLEGGREMSTEDLFGGLEPTPYEAEARERWGDTEAYREASRRTKRYREEDWARMREEGEGLLARLAHRMRAGASAQDSHVLQLAEEHRMHIDRWFYPCSLEAHCGLADLYVEEPRFTASLDRHGEGLARFLAQAIRANARS